MNLSRTRDPRSERNYTDPAAPGLGRESDPAEDSDLAQELGVALDRNELSLHYQPQFELPGVQLAGSEALLRWNHPQRGMISPAHFIPVAEHCGLIVPIGTWVLREACRQNQLWQQAGYDPIRVAVNVSAQQFAQVDFLNIVELALEGSGLDPRYLELELSETMLIQSAEVSLQRLKNLKALGVRLSMDDFGTAVLSLREMVRLPLDTLKIDVAVVSGMNQEPGTLRLVKAILALGHSLGMDVIAEGVETDEQLEQLRLLGCDKAQGFLFSAAVSADDSEAYHTPVGGPVEPREPL
jgi:EAL domain-containing protein (putative c-di-GMP-specific phosphodiesterase class I)